MVVPWLSSWLSTKIGVQNILESHPCICSTKSSWNPYNFTVFIHFCLYKSHPFCSLSACVQSTPLCSEYLSTLYTCLHSATLINSCKFQTVTSIFICFASIVMCSFSYIIATMQSFVQLKTNMRLQYLKLGQICMLIWRIFTKLFTYFFNYTCNVKCINLATPYPEFYQHSRKVDRL